MAINNVTYSPLIRAMHVASNAMFAQNQRLFIISQNLSNVGIRVSPQSTPYQRQVVLFKNEFDSKLGIKLVKYKGVMKDKSAPQVIYDPSHPFADNKGNVVEANIKSNIELADMREASRSHESCLRAFEKVLNMLQNTLSLLKA
jgi:flagellar basal-body rod protein FlgC